MFALIVLSGIEVDRLNNVSKPNLKQLHFPLKHHGGGSCKLLTAILIIFSFKEAVSIHMLFQYKVENSVSCLL